MPCNAVTLHDKIFSIRQGFRIVDVVENPLKRMYLFQIQEFLTYTSRNGNYKTIMILVIFSSEIFGLISQTKLENLLF